jgi:aspartate aminotransferase-like enzyme
MPEHGPLRPLLLLAPGPTIPPDEERYGVMFQRGLGRLADRTFRIGHLGVGSQAELARGFEALEGTLAVLSGAAASAGPRFPAATTGE